jgi:hypothetical protein
MGEETREVGHSNDIRFSYLERRLAAQYAFIRFDTAAF